MANHQDELKEWHRENRELTDLSFVGSQQPRFNPGTQRYDSVYNQITTNANTMGGSLLIDKSSLYHLQGKYTFRPIWADITFGGEGRIYRPYSEGTLFSDTLSYKYDDKNSKIVDSTFTKIQNNQIGLYMGMHKELGNENKFKIDGIIRIDKNRNFKPVLSPAISLVYSSPKEDIFRISLSAGIRNPTLLDQYQYQDVGRAILRGNIDGFDSLVTIESFKDYTYNLSLDTLTYFNVAPVAPEKVKTIEIGYRGNWGSKIYVDMDAYQSWYTNFIGYNIGIDVKIDPLSRLPSYTQVYRMAANAKSNVTTTGYAIGLNYYVSIKYSISGNYSFNVLNKQGTDDPLIPAYNTPKNKFNIGIKGQELKLPFTSKNGFGFAANFNG